MEEAKYEVILYLKFYITNTDQKEVGTTSLGM